MKLLKRIFGICETPLPADTTAWVMGAGKVSIELDKMPELKKPGSGVRLEGRGVNPRLLVFHGDDGQFHAIANRCTHMGRRIDVIAGTNTIQCCSVGKSTFTYEGELVGGSAKKPVNTFPVSVEDNLLTITLNG